MNFIQNTDYVSQCLDFVMDQLKNVPLNLIVTQPEIAQKSFIKIREKDC